MSRTRFGDYVRSYMIILLLMNASLCYVLRRSVDNYGHAGGVIAGVWWAWRIRIGSVGDAVAPVGRPESARSRFFRSAASPRRGLTASNLCALAIVKKGEDERHAKLETIHRRMLDIDALTPRQQSVLGNLVTIDVLYLELVRRGPNAGMFPSPRDTLAPPHSSKRITAADISLMRIRELLVAQLKFLKTNSLELETKPTDQDYRRVVELVERSTKRAPTPGETVAYQRSFITLVRRVSAENKAAVARFKKLEEEARKLRDGK